MELSLNGQSTEAATTVSRAHFTFFNDHLFHIAELEPLGGPATGGTRVTVTLGDGFETLVPLADLGGSRHGLYCRFIHAGGWQERVAASMSAGADTLLCDSPAFTGAGRGESSTGSLTTFDVSLNGQDYTDSSRTFRFYDADSWRLLSMQPRGGPVIGGTIVTFQAALGVRSLGAARCLFGSARPVPASIDATEGAAIQLRCASPRAWIRQQHGESVELTVSVNGAQQSLRAVPHARVFTYFPVQPVGGLGIDRLNPSGGPSAGGTLIHVHGARLRNLGGLQCLFSPTLDPAPASWVGFEHIKCAAPALPVPLTLPTTKEAGGHFFSDHVRVSVNGVVDEASLAGPIYSYYMNDEFRIEHLYPRGGPIAGGTNVTVTGFAFAELDHGDGLSCRFGEAPLVPGTLTGPSLRGRELVCVSPPSPGGSGETVVVRVTSNGQDFTRGDYRTNIGFTYYEFE